MRLLKTVRFFIFLTVTFFLLTNQGFTANLIRNIPCERIVNYTIQDSNGNPEKRYQIYYFKDKNKANSDCIMILCHYNQNMVINGKKYDYLYKGYDGYYISPVDAAEDILSHHIKTGDIRKSYDYVWFASGHTNRFQTENKLSISGMRLWILRMNEMYYSYEKGLLKIWDGKP